MIEESQLSVEKLTATLKILLEDQNQLKVMSKNLKEIAIPNAADRVAAICREICCGK